MYKCKFCGREFEKQQGWASHVCKCKLNPDRDIAMKHLAYARSCRKFEKQKDTTEYNCQYCGKVCIGKNSLVNHERLCKNNPNRQIIKSNFIKYNEDCRNGITHHPHKGQTKETCDSLKKMSETKRQKFESGEINGSFLNHHHSNESKEKMRKSAFEYLKTMKDIKCPRYNVKSIEYINLINDKYGWNLQHAENGGEIEICGFYVDGYDKDLNIVSEYDEPNHYKDVKNSILKNKDIERQNIIIEKTGCTFYRYNEYIDLLYVVSK